MANELDYGLKPLNQFSTPAGAPEDYEPDQTEALRNFVMQQYLANFTKAMSPIAPPPVMSGKEQRLRRWGPYPYKLEEERTRPFQMAQVEQQQAIANLGALEPIIRAMMQQQMTPYQAGRLGETERHNVAIEGLAEQRIKQPKQATEPIVYDQKTGRAFTFNRQTRQAQPIDLPGGAAAGKQPTEAARSGVEDLKLVKTNLDQYETLGNEVIKTDPNRWKALGQQFAFGTGPTGQSLIESSDPTFASAAATRAGLLRTIARMVERGRLSDFDLIQISPMLPTVASLATPEGRSNFTMQISKFRKELKTRLKMRAAQHPELFEPEELADIDEGEADFSNLSDEELLEAIGGKQK